MFFMAQKFKDLMLKLRLQKFIQELSFMFFTLVINSHQLMVQIVFILMALMVHFLKGFVLARTWFFLHQ